MWPSTEKWLTYQGKHSLENSLSSRSSQLSVSPGYSWYFISNSFIHTGTWSGLSLYGVCACCHNPWGNSHVLLMSYVFRGHCFLFIYYLWLVQSFYFLFHKSLEEGCDIGVILKGLNILESFIMSPWALGGLWWPPSTENGNFSDKGLKHTLFMSIKIHH